jgi:hypothetical protein
VQAGQQQAEQQQGRAEGAGDQRPDDQAEAGGQGCERNPRVAR